MMTPLVRAWISSAAWRRSGEVRPAKVMRAPSERTTSTFTLGASTGMAISAVTPKWRAASATAWAWLPEL